MKTYIVQLEDHDDVISARDKMSWSKARRILLVWPRKGRVLERRVDLLLLLRQSQALGGQLALVTKSSAVKEQAAVLGIPVFVDALEAQEASWRRQRVRKKSPTRIAQLRKRKPVDPQKLREKRLAGLRLQRTAFMARLAANRWLRLVVFSLAVIAFLFLALAFVPGAEVVVKPQRSPQQIDIAVWASPDITAPSANGGLPVETFLVVVEGRDQVESSGRAKIPEAYSRGQVTLTNLTDQVVEVPEGSVLLTTNTPALRFVTRQMVRISAGPEKFAQAAIQAEVPGSDGNLPAGRIRAMEGPVGLRLRVFNSAPTYGGTDRSSRSPTDEDYEGLRDRLMANLKANALEEALSLLKPGQRLLDGMLVENRIVEEKRDPPENQPADELQLSLRVEFAAWTVSEADLQAIAQAALDANQEIGYSPVPGSLNITFTTDPKLDKEGAEETGIQAGQVLNQGMLTARWNMRVERTLEKRWTKEATVRSIQGRRLAEAKQILEEGLSLSDVPQIAIFPRWWGRLPFLPARIKVVSQ